VALKEFLVLAIIFSAFFLLLGVVTWFRADMAYARGVALADAGYLYGAESSLQAATTLWSAEPAYHRELAAVYSRLALVAGEQRAHYAELAAREAARSLKLNSRNILTLKSLVSTYFNLSHASPVYRIQVENIVQQAIDLCPTDPVLWYFKALVLLSAEKPVEARAALDRALVLKPDYAKAQEVRDSLSR